MQRITIIGNLASDPVVADREWTNKETGEVFRNKVCNFSIAADNGHGPSKTTTFFRVAAWRGLAEICEKFLKKGRQVYIEGPIKQSNYIDNEKNYRSVIEVTANVIELLQDGKRFVAPEETEEEPLY